METNEMCTSTSPQMIYNATNAALDAIMKELGLSTTQRNDMGMPIMNTIIYSLYCKCESYPLVKSICETLYSTEYKNPD